MGGQPVFTDQTDVAALMFERFTVRARRIIVLAQEEARSLNHDYLGTEHILLGLINEGAGVAIETLERLDVGLAAVRDEVEETVGRGKHTPSGHIPFTPRAKRVLELSLREALQLDHNYIGTEHLLTALVREGEGVAAQVLQQAGAELEKVRQTVIGILDEGELDDADKPLRPPVSIDSAIFQARFAVASIERLITELEALRD